VTTERDQRPFVPVRVRFVTIMQRYSGQRELVMPLPEDPREAVDALVRRFEIPWAGALEKSVRIFVNKELLEAHVKSGRPLREGDRISFVPLSDGG
jgi:molybdopterin converting factor small subunit